MRKGRSVALADMDADDHLCLQVAIKSNGVQLLLPVEAPTETEACSVPGYSWTPQTEARQTSACMAWLSGLVKLPRDKVFVEVRTQGDLLDVPATSAPWLPFSLRGTCDVAIVDGGCFKGHATSRGLLVVFQLKKAVQERDAQRALAQLIAADVHSSFPVVTVLADLKDEWHFFWTNEGAVHQIRAQFKLAIQWLNLFVGADESRSTPFAKRHKLAPPPTLFFDDADGLEGEDALHYKLHAAREALSRLPWMRFDDDQ